MSIARKYQSEPCQFIFNWSRVRTADGHRLWHSMYHVNYYHANSLLTCHRSILGFLSEEIASHTHLRMHQLAFNTSRTDTQKPPKKPILHLANPKHSGRSESRVGEPVSRVHWENPLGQDRLHIYSCLSTVVAWPHFSFISRFVHSFSKPGQLWRVLTVSIWQVSLGVHPGCTHWVHNPEGNFVSICRPASFTSILYPCTAKAARCIVTCFRKHVLIFMLDGC